MGYEALGISAIPTHPRFLLVLSVSEERSSTKLFVYNEVSSHIL